MNAKFSIVAGIVIFSAAAFTTNAVHAQKKDNIQEESIWSSDLHIDGKADDWQGPPVAENRNTGVSYTMANDNENVYLLVQSDDVSINTKILLGGISLSVNTEGKKKLENSYRITYPYAGQKARDLRWSVAINTNDLRRMTDEEIDSMQMTQGNAALSAMKDIRVDGFKDVSDSLISVYNEYAIKAGSRFDEKGVFTCEFAVPINFLGCRRLSPVRSAII